MTISQHRGLIYPKQGAILPMDAVLALVVVWRNRARQRRRLAALDDHLRDDLGLSRADVAAECAKPFWR